MQRWATSDEHFGHQNILTGWNDPEKARPFATMDDMVEGIIDRHNAVVRDGDEVYHLGDMFWRSFGFGRAISVMQRLHGQHFYILGNHDELILDNPFTLQSQFSFVGDRLFLKDKLNKYGIVLDHYAGRVWQGSHKGSWQLYGHSHGNLPEEDYLSMDVGVDSNNFTPVAFEDIAVRMTKKVEQREKFIKHWKNRESITD